jgi:hypothetical protein
MPLFNQKYTFIHIPKSGGSSVEKWLKMNGMIMTHYCSEKKILVNGHSPQHCTFLELEELNLLTENIFTIVRPEIDRVISEFFFLQKFQPSLGKKFFDFDSFLDSFLDKKNSLLFDNHNLSNFDFLKNKNNEIDEKIKIFNFFDIPSIEGYFGLKGLNVYRVLQTEKNNFQPTEKQTQRIIEFFTLS